MSDKELKELIASIGVYQVETARLIRELREGQKRTDEQLAKTNAQIAKTEAQIAKTEAQIAKTEAQIAKTEAQLAKTDEKLKKIGVLVGNISNNQGDVAEEFFYNSLERSKKLGNLSFDYISSNIKNRAKGVEDEFDIVAYNGDSIVIVETKYKFHPNDVKKIKNQKIKNFRKLFPNYKDYKIYGAIAGFKIPKEAVERAKEDGLFILKRVGDIAKVDASSVTAY